MRKKYTLFLCLLLVAGLAVLLYPTFSSAVNRHSGSYAIQSWQQQMDQLDSTDRQEQLQQAQTYNLALRSGELPDNYSELLNTGSGMMGHIRIPSIQVDLPIYHGVEEEVLAKGVGHLPGSALPVGGAGTHAVLTGHTGLPSAELFTDLTELREGDRFYIHVLEQVLCYQIDQIKVVLPSEGSDLAVVDGEDYCTLVTCTPYGINSHRLLVRGHRVTEEAAAPMPETPVPAHRRNGWLLLLLIPAVAAPFFVKRLLDGCRKPLYNGKYLSRSRPVPRSGRFRRAR